MNRVHSVSCLCDTTRFPFHVKTTFVAFSPVKTKIRRANGTTGRCGNFLNILFHYILLGADQ